jgi:glycosyltransferase involved in cell wall biosynthesis
LSRKKPIGVDTSSRSGRKTIHQSSEEVHVARERTTWAIITGEYPPQPGGVSGYSWVVAHALAATGDDVHVFAPGVGLAELESPVRVHRLSDIFGAKGRRELYAGLDALPSPRRALLQFVLQAFGMRAVNLPFIWSLRRLRGYPLWMYFHEFALDDNPAESYPRRFQAFMTRMLARQASRWADIAFVSIPAWTPFVKRAAPNLPIFWLPIPSNIATTPDLTVVAELSARFRSGAGGPLIGHFGTYRMRDSRRFLEQILPALCRADANRRVLLLGRGSDKFATLLIEHEPALADRIVGLGDLDSQALANHLAACDLLLQPYAEGVTTRRGSFFAALALGVPTVTTLGPLSEDLWSESGAAFFGPPDDIPATIAIIDSALADSAARHRVGERARDLYMSRFDVSHTVQELRTR